MGKMKALCVFSANVALHFADERGVVPLKIQGAKLIVKAIDILPSESGEGEDIVVFIGDETLVFKGVSPDIQVEGSSANIGYTLNKLGQDPIVAATIGDDQHGRTIEHTLGRDGIRFKPFSCRIETAVTAAVSNPDGLTTLFCVKPPGSFDPSVIADQLKQEVDCPAYVVATSVRDESELRLTQILFEAHPDSVKAFIPHSELLLQEKESPSQLFEEVLALADVVQFNEREANLLTKGVDGELSAFSSEDLQLLIDRFGSIQPEVLIVTLGQKGAATVVFRDHGHEEYSHDAYPIKAVDTTGSGDNFLAAFLYAQSQGVTHKQAVNFASWLAAENAKGRGGHYAQVNADSLRLFLADEVA